MRRTPVILASIGLVLLLSATGVSLGEALRERAIPAESRLSAAAPTAAPALDAHIGVQVLGVTVERDAQLAAPHGGLAMPTLEARRSIGVSSPPATLAARVALLGAASSAPSAQSSGPVNVQTPPTILTPTSGIALAAAAAFAGASVLAYFWPMLKKLLLFPAIALYAKISRAEVFENQVRERIFTAIRATPGVSATDLSRVAGVAWGTTIYHLDVLEQTRMVCSVREGRRRRYFENGAQLDAPKEIVMLLSNPVTKGVVGTVQTAPGLTQKELAAATGMTPQALHWHLARLVGAGLVRKERAGRVVRHFA